MTAVPRCLWCAKQFPPRTAGGHTKRFCSAACRARFHTALGRWAQGALAAGRVSIDDLRATQGVVHDAVDGRFGGSTLATIPPRG
jgi:endogenous inhibitor of DNA gyrase (YacG/DUF329 family)